MLEIKEQKFDMRFCAKAYTIMCVLGLFALDAWLMFTSPDIFANAFEGMVLIHGVMSLSMLFTWMVTKWCWNHISYCNKGYETVIRVH